MLTLRPSQVVEGPDAYRVDLDLYDGNAHQTATSHFTFALTPQQHENLRWYLEDYLQYPGEPAPQIAAAIEQDLAEIGIDLFGRVFESSDAARAVWTTLRPHVDDARIEIVHGEALPLP